MPTTVRDSVVTAATASLAQLLTQIPEVKQAVTDPAQFIKTTLKLPAFYPVVHDARAMRDGALWLRLQDAAQFQQWLVTDATLKPHTLVQLPRAVRLEDVAHGRVWVAERDSLDVMTVVAYRLPVGK